MKWKSVLILTALFAGSTANADTGSTTVSPLRPQIQSGSQDLINSPATLQTIHPSLKVPREPEPKPKLPVIGFGTKRSTELMLFPFHHPLMATSKATFPIRHPLDAYRRWGHMAEPYQPALNATSALCGPATTAGVYTINHR